jgi:hypothetical protein
MSQAIADIIPLVRAIYEKNCVGCCLHLALDDGNMEDHHVQFCLDWAKTAGHPDCIECAKKLLAMTKEERDKLYAMYGAW